MTDFDRSASMWRTSSASGGANCVAVAFIERWVLIRDSANPEGGVLRVSRAAWNLFLAETRNADVDVWLSAQETALPSGDSGQEQ